MKYRILSMLAATNLCFCIMSLAQTSGQFANLRLGNDPANYLNINTANSPSGIPVTANFDFAGAQFRFSSSSPSGNIAVNTEWATAPLHAAPQPGNSTGYSTNAAGQLVITPVFTVGKDWLNAPATFGNNTLGIGLYKNGTIDQLAYIQAFRGGVDYNGMLALNPAGGKVLIGGRKPISDMLIRRGLPNAGDYILSVDGCAVFRQIMVIGQNDFQSLWPDYVFSKEYKLRSLRELRTFISQEKHLPGIPTTAETVNQGIDIVQTQAKLLEKIEELTLYILQLEERLSKVEPKKQP